MDAPYHGAFIALSAARTGGMNGANPIAIGEIRHYLDLVGIASPDARSKYLRLVQRLDAVYLKFCADKAEKPTKPG